MSTSFPGFPPNALNRVIFGKNVVPIKTFPQRPTAANKKYRPGQFAILNDNPSTGSAGELWYLSHFVAGVPQWIQLAGGGTDIEEFVVSSGTSPVVPSASNQITLVDGNGVGITGGLNQWTTDMISPFTGNFIFRSITSGNTEILTVENTSDTANSKAQILIQTAGNAASDCWTTWSVIAAKNYSAGIDNSETNDNWKLTDGADPSLGTSLINIDVANPSITFGTTGAIGTPSGTLLQRPTTAADGMMRNNSDSNRIEFYENGAWRFLPDSTEGKLLQFVEAETSSLVNCNVVIPYDNTIPLQTEGIEVLTLSITPISDSSNLFIQFNASGSLASGTIAWASVALFRDATADALAANAMENTETTNGANANFSLFHNVSSGSTSSTTFKIRIGPNIASSFYLNGDVAGAARYGGVSSSVLTITEIEV